MSNDQERAKFEAWASKCFDWSPKGVATDQTQSGGYHDRELMLCWTAWQAARADLVGDAALLREALEALEELRPMTAYGVVGTRDAEQARRQHNLDNIITSLRAALEGKEKP